MTELRLKLPDDLAQRAKSAGLLSNAAIQQLLEDAMRRAAGRKLPDVAERVFKAISLKTCGLKFDRDEANVR